MSEVRLTEFRAIKKTEKGTVYIAIDHPPTIDAVEVVRHGRWEERTFFNGCTPDRDLFCSCCNHDRGWYLWEYCPYCGARMDGQGEGDAE